MGAHDLGLLAARRTRSRTPRRSTLLDSSPLDAHALGLLAARRTSSWPHRRTRPRAPRRSALALSASSPLGARVLGPLGACLLGLVAAWRTRPQPPRRTANALSNPPPGPMRSQPPSPPPISPPPSQSLPPPPIACPSHLRPESTASVFSASLTYGSSRLTSGASPLPQCPTPPDLGRRWATHSARHRTSYGPTPRYDPTPSYDSTPSYGPALSYGPAPFLTEKKNPSLHPGWDGLTPMHWSHLYGCAKWDLLYDAAST
ncbi:hypothetical protein T492DRAFT_307424 [Pavlovales sp. CCMP2436]|nr:hypothetical protein T492DRAFT_307424 [Pavlovales sp. CCMP2436]